MSPAFAIWIGNISSAEKINNEIDFDAHKLKASLEEKKVGFSAIISWPIKPGSSV